MEQPTLPPSSRDHRGARDDGQIPGLVVVFAGGNAGARVMPLAAGEIELGRHEGSPGHIDDGRVSRRHARVAIDDGRWMATDLGSQNGTFVDGTKIAAHASVRVDRVLRIGDSLLVPCGDVRPFERHGVRMVDGFVRGPAMQALIEDAERLGRSGSTLHVRGESGAGKEGVVQAFHRASARGARALVAVNCATIPHALAERLLFGAKRGAYSGADVDATGYVIEADGGTLFLDEIAELDAQVQAKLLRVLESKDVVPLGASKPRKVDFALCSATNKDLRALVGAGTLREDLYFRVGTPTVILPALRERPEEIPALIAHELAQRSVTQTAQTAQTAHVSLVEQCLLRPWPGNVRELLAEVRTAAQAALPESRVAALHLSATAGSAFGRGVPDAWTAPASGQAVEPTRKAVVRSDAEWRPRIEDALRIHGGNIAAASRAIGLHRTQMRRIMDRLGIAATASASDDETGD